MIVSYYGQMDPTITPRELILIPKVRRRFQNPKNRSAPNNHSETPKNQSVEPGKGAGLLDGSLVVQEENLRWLIQKVGGPVLYT
jgi:hypothetical protein